MKGMTVWIVEMFHDTRDGWGKWSPTIGIALNRKEGREVLKQWRSRNPFDKFILTKYTPEGY